MKIDGKKRKQHIENLETDKHVKMWCGKKFDKEDFLRQRRHIARRIEEATCLDCLSAMSERISKRFKYLVIDLGTRE